MTWVLVTWNVLMVAWAVFLAVTARSDLQCINRSGLRVCNSPDSAATLGVAVVVFIAVVGDLFGGIVWLLTRGHGRPCAVCGRPVRPKQTCKACGHDASSVVPVPMFERWPGAATPSGPGGGEPGGR
jgi:hypothetical protein